MTSRADNTALALVVDNTLTPAFDPSRRGYHVLYRQGQPNWCPGCGRSHWYVGRLSAECGFCATAIPLTEGM